jgi:hypothetical protein
MQAGAPHAKKQVKHITLAMISFALVQINSRACSFFFAEIIQWRLENPRQQLNSFVRIHGALKSSS